MNMDLIIVTGNNHKYEEYKEFFSNISQHKIELVEIQGTAEEIVTHKVKQAYSLLRKPCIVDDTGLVFEYWNNLPGPYVKHFNKIIGVDKYPSLLGKNNRATAYCIIAYMDENGIKLFKGQTKGIIVTPRRDNGFGFDKVFMPDGYNKTYSEMSIEEKNSVSHRAKAMKKLRDWLDSKISNKIQ